MMNLFQLQEQLKDFSKDQLLQEMQSPSGSAPPFLVMTELQRRTRMENAAALDKGPPTSTVAQDAVNAAGVPQGGIADMARSMAPQTDMTQNTGMMTPQAGVAPQGAAPVQAMQEGGLLGDPLGTYAQYLDQTYSNPKIESFVSEVKGLEEDTFGQPSFGGQTPFGSPQGGGSYGMQTQPATPLGSGMGQVGAMMQQNPVGMRSLVASDNPMASILGGGSGAPGIRNDNNAPGNPLSTRHNLNAMVLPSVKRMQEGGLAGISRNVSDYYSQAAADMALDNRMNSDARASAVDRAPSEFYAAKVIEGRATPEDLALLDRQARSAGMETDAFIQAVLNGDPEAPPELGPQVMDQIIEGPMAGRATGVGPAEFDVPDRLLQGQRGGGAADFTPRPEAPAGISGIGDAIARARAAERAGEIGARRGPPEQAAPGPGNFIDVSDTTFSTPSPAYRSMDEMTAPEDPQTWGQRNIGAPLRSFFQPIGEDLRSIGQPIGAGIERGFDYLVDGPSTYRSMDEMTALSGDTPPTQRETSPGSRGRTQGGGGTNTDWLSDLFSGGRAIDDRRRGTGGYRPEGPLVPTEDLAAMTPEELLPAAPEASALTAETPPEAPVLTPETPTGPAGGGATSGATVGGMPVPSPQSAEDRMLQQDKWLALARFGAALASSQAPTFGQALGQAGQVGLDALQQARQDFLTRKEAADKMALARATLAARTAGGGKKKDTSDFGLSASQARALGPLNDDISRLEQALMDAEADAAASEPWFGSPDEELVEAANTIRNNLAALKLRRANIVRFGAGLPATDGAVADSGGPGYDVADKN